MADKSIVIAKIIDLNGEEIYTKAKDYRTRHYKRVTVYFNEKDEVFHKLAQACAYFDLQLYNSVLEPFTTYIPIFRKCRIEEESWLNQRYSGYPFWKYDLRFFHADCVKKLKDRHCINPECPHYISQGFVLPQLSKIFDVKTSIDLWESNMIEFLCCACYNEFSIGRKDLF